MPFPPTPDHVWDITTPADTQPANQGGADFRNLKDDVMQRMSLLSGTLANRPTPETVNATWGGAGFGLTYFSTDTKQIFQWNGSSWVDISSSLPIASGASLFVVGGVINAPANTSVNTIYSYTVPGNTMGINGGFEVEFSVNYGTAGTFGSLSFVFGGVSIDTLVFNNATTVHIKFRVVNASATNSNFWGIETNGIGPNQPICIFSVSSMGVDTTFNQAINISFQKNLSGDTAIFSNFYVRKI